MSRQLTQEEEVVVARLYDAKAAGQLTHAYVTTTKPLVVEHWNGKHPSEHNCEQRRIPAGSTLKIVMVSRFGDCGLTDKLDADYGYGLRINFDDYSICDIRLKP